jgi:hypothetical protein
MKKYISLGLSVAALGCSTTGMAATGGDDGKSLGLVIVPSIGYAHKTLNFDQKFNVVDESQSLDVTLPTLQLGLAAAYGKFSVAIKHEDTIGNTFADTDVGDAGPVSNVNREDLSVTLSYKLTDNISLFTGYLEGETGLTPIIAFGPTDEEGATFPAPANPDFANVEGFEDFTGFGGNTAFDKFIADKGTYQQNYEEDGFFLGASYTHKIPQLKGAFTFSLAYANLDGQYTDNAAGPDHDVFDYQGDTAGYSMAASWNGTLGRRVGYSLDLRRNAFEFEGDDKTGNFSDTSVKTDEFMTSVSATVRYFVTL